MTLKQNIIELLLRSKLGEVTKSQLIKKIESQEIVDTSFLNTYFRSILNSFTIKSGHDVRIFLENGLSETNWLLTFKMHVLPTLIKFHTSEDTNNGK